MLHICCLWPKFNQCQFSPMPNLGNYRAAEFKKKYQRNREKWKRILLKYTTQYSRVVCTHILSVIVYRVCSLNICGNKCSFIYLFYLFYLCTGRKNCTIHYDLSIPYCLNKKFLWFGANQREAKMIRVQERQVAFLYHILKSDWLM